MEKKKKGATKGKSKTSQQEVYYRVNTLFKAILAGVILDTFKLREISVTQDWDVSDRQLTNYRKMALTKFSEMAEFDVKEEMGIALARYQTVFNQAMVAKKHKEAISAQKEICTLLGLNTATKHEVTGKDGKDLQVTPFRIEVIQAGKLIKDVNDTDN